jgi:hypothetical protein
LIASGMQDVSMTLDCAILSRQKASFEAISPVSLTAAHTLVPFEGVVARGRVGGVCPIEVQRAEPHFSAVSDRGRKHACALSVRSLRHASMLRMFRGVRPIVLNCVDARASVLGERSFAPTCFGCPTGTCSAACAHACDRSFDTKLPLT